jgi:hypothetical protein
VSGKVTNDHVDTPSVHAVELARLIASLRERVRTRRSWDQLTPEQQFDRLRDRP